jgi:carboxymethylenebutenolidase
MGEDIRLKSAAGEIGAYLATPKGSPKGGIVVIQEIFGVNAHIRAVTDKFAADGYIALAPRYFDHIKPGIELGYTPDTIAEGRGYVMSPGFTDKAVQDTDAAIQELKKRGARKVGVVGFCWGGGAANDLAVAAPDLAASVAYYGRQPKAEDAAKIKAPLLLHYAGLDDRTNAGIDPFKKALDAAGKEYTVYVYEGANHAFNNDTSEARYNKQAAELAWGRTIEFFKQKLG